MDSNVLEGENYEIFDSNKYEYEEEFECLREGEPDDIDSAPQNRSHVLDKEYEDEEYFPREGEEEEEIGEEDDIPMSWVNIEFDIDGQQGDVDSRSIADQDKIVRHWEDKIATGEVSILPRQTEVKKSSTFDDLSEFKSQVETDSIANLASTKSIWERKAAESSTDAVPFKPSGLTSSRSWDAGRGVGYRDTNVRAHDLHKTSIPEYESAIDREIRLAQEREEELKQQLQRQHLSDDKEKGSWEAEDHRKMPIGKVPPPVRVVEVVPKKSVAADSVGSRSQQQSHVILPELAHGDPDSSTDASTSLSAPGSKARMETVIEREIREQQEKEAVLRQAALNRQNFNKEQEQSEYERQEKEQERINAHESIVEREIRLQREKEVELARQRGVPPPVDHTPTPSELSVSSSEPVSPPLIDTTDSVSFSKSPQVNTSMSDSRDTLSPDSGVASVDSKLVTYEEAISAYSHRGENLIAKELKEQKEREEELRKRWNDMGVKSPFTPQEPDTPYNMPEPQQPKPIPGHLSMVSSSNLTNGTSSQGAFNNGPSKSTGGFYQQGIKSYMEPPSNTVRRGSVDSDRSHSSSGDGPVKSQTFAVEDEQDGQSYSYVPRDETPIEREIRLAKEREEELRAQKGLSPRGTAADRGDMLMEMKVDMPSRPQNLERGQMKHFSSGRLQYEMEKEKQRELSMQKEGRVLTLSEERAETKKYMDVIDKDNLNAPAPSPQKTPTSSNISRHGAYMRSPSMPIYNNPSFYTSSPARSDMGDRKISAPGSIAQSAGPVENGANADRSPARSPEPEAYSRPVARSVSHQSKLSSNTSNTAELKIEAELREMREREEELRRQRDLAMGRTPEPLDERPDERAHSPQPPKTEVYPRSNTVYPGDVGERKVRKKSALAQQWEQKFGGNA